MSDTSAFGFGKFVPGFDFLKNLAQSSQQAQPGVATAMPNMASWVAPTLNVEELDKRIQELKAVQFWLDQNAVALKATIQAMEVQKMTLTTLQGMNVNMADLAKAFTASVPTVPAAAAPEPAVSEPPATVKTAEPAAAEAAKPSEAPDAPADAKPAVDPMLWWGSLTQQFQDIAAAALKDVAAQALKDGPQKAAAKAGTKSAKAAPVAAQTAAAKTRSGAAKKAAPRKASAKAAAAKSAAPPRK